MAKSYSILVNFHQSLDGRSRVTQYLDVTSAGPEFDILLQMLNNSDAVESISVYLSSWRPVCMGSGLNTRLTRDDLGIRYDNVLEKIK